MAFELIYFSSNRILINANYFAQVFWIEPFRKGCRSHQISKHHG